MTAATEASLLGRREGKINEEEEEKAGAIQGGEAVDVQVITGRPHHTQSPSNGRLTGAWDVGEEVRRECGRRGTTQNLKG